MTTPHDELSGLLDRLKAGGVARAGGLSLHWDGRIQHWVLTHADNTCALTSHKPDLLTYLEQLDFRWALDAEARA